jgi:hypothetical protein
LMAGDREQMNEELQGENKGIFTLTQSALETVGNLERARQNYSLTLNEQDEATRTETLKSLLNDMGEFMESYGFRDYLKNKFVDEYNFYDIESLVDETEGDLDLIRAGSRIGFSIWGETIRQLGVGLPTFRVKHGIMRKLIGSLYSLTLDKIDIGGMVHQFEQFPGVSHKPNLNRLSFAISGMRNCDIDFNGVIAGRARIGKSSLTADMVELIYGFRGENIYQTMPDNRPWYEHFLDQRLIFEPGHGQAAIKDSNGDVNWFDESYFTLDRRRSMSKKNIDLTRDWNAYASKKSVNISLIQNFGDMDLRGTSKAVMVMVLIERGYGLLFSDARWIPLVRDQFGFEQLMEHPDQMKDKETAIHMLKSRREFVCEFTWPDRGAWTAVDPVDNIEKVYGAKQDPFYAYYLKKKLEFQASPSGEEAKEAQKESKKENDRKYRIMGMFYREGMKPADIAKKERVTLSYIGQVTRGQ